MKPKKQRRRLQRGSNLLPEARLASNGIPSKTLSWQVNDVLSLVAQNFIPAQKTTLLHPKSLKTLSRICGSWIETVPQLSATGQQGIALQASMKAFAVAILSEKSPTSASTVDALVAHGTAIRSIHLALRNPRVTRPNELLAAIMFLLLSEVCLINTRAALISLIQSFFKKKIILPSASSSDTHVSGLAQLMHCQGPSYYRSGLPHGLFTGLRPSLVSFLKNVSKPNDAKFPRLYGPYVNEGQSFWERMSGPQSHFATLLQTLCNRL